MKITCNREKFLAAFQTVASVAPVRSPKPILSNVKVEVKDKSAVLTATDLEVGIRIEVPEIEVQTPGSAVLPVARFGSILRENTDDTLYIEADPQGAVVKGERSEFKLPGENPAEFPAFPEFQEEKYHELPSRLFRELGRRTLFATDTESARYALGGVLLEMAPEKITAVATDGRRLAKMEGPARSVGGHGTEGMTTIVPTRAMQLIERALSDADAEIRLIARANDVQVKSPRVTIFTRLVEGRFPRWRDVFPARRSAQKIELAVGPLYSALRQAAVVASEESRGIDFTFSKGNLILAGSTAEVGQSRVEMPIAYDGNEIVVSLDHKFVADFLKVLDPESTFTLDIENSDSAALCTTEDGYGYVIMPLARDRG
jgi:DNA polymerase-3 subunit beta